MKGLIVKTLDSSTDARGEFVTLYQRNDLSEIYYEDDISISKKNVLRGLHGDGHTKKLISCLMGSVLLVVADPDSKLWASVFLSSANRAQVFVPGEYAVGYLVFTDQAIVHYKQSTVYGTYPQFTIRWNDPEYGIDWGIKHPILSDRDANA